MFLLKQVISGHYEFNKIFIGFEKAYNSTDINGFFKKIYVKKQPIY